jgi:uncharacterized membrane protein YqjE
VADIRPQQGLYDSARRLLATGLELTQVRLELLGLEVEQEKVRLFDAVALALLALLAVAVGALLLCAWLVLLVEPDQRRLVVALLALAFIGGGGAGFVIARSWLRRSGELFKLTATELARDREHLRAQDGDQP